jgi:hypothetical protein
LAFGPPILPTETPTTAEPTGAGPGDRGVEDSVPRSVPWPVEGEPADPPTVATPPAGDGDSADAPLDDATDVPGYDPVRDSPEGLQAQRRISGGIALTVAGTVLTVGAIGLGATDPCRPLAGNSCQVGARNRAAWVIGVPGVAILAGGITLLTLGLLKRQRIRAGVVASKTSGGVVLSGRF